MMKNFVVLLYCISLFEKLTRAHSSNVLSARTYGEPASPGEHPWVVLLRTVEQRRGLLGTRMGALIASNWVLTYAFLLDGSSPTSFIWVRYGAVEAARPALVTETADYRLYPHLDLLHGLALVALNRHVETTVSIRPVALVGGSVPPAATFCGYGQGTHGAWILEEEILRCFEVDLEIKDSLPNPVIVANSDENRSNNFNMGAPLVSDGVLLGVLSWPGIANPVGEFLQPTYYLDWIQEETGLEFKAGSPPQVKNPDLDY